MKKDKIVYLCIIGITLIFALLYIQHSTREMDYTACADSLDLAEIVNTEDLYADDLTHRNGKLIIERIIGVVDDASNGDGHVLDDEDSYISYNSVSDISKGNVICTYLIYNPDTNYVDDIIARFDYVIDGRQGK